MSDSMAGGSIPSAGGAPLPCGMGPKRGRSQRFGAPTDPSLGRAAAAYQGGPLAGRLPLAGVVEGPRARGRRPRARCRRPRARHRRPRARRRRPCARHRDHVLVIGDHVLVVGDHVLVVGTTCSLSGTTCSLSGTTCSLSGTTCSLSGPRARCRRPRARRRGPRARRLGPRARRLGPRARRLARRRSQPRCNALCLRESSKPFATRRVQTNGHDTSASQPAAPSRERAPPEQKASLEP